VCVFTYLAAEFTLTVRWLPGGKAKSRRLTARVALRRIDL
jgi:hypothetical protein